MKRIEVKLALAVVAPLLDVIRELSEALRREPAAPVGLDDLDPEFRAAWTDEIVAAQAEEVRILLALFDDEFFREGVVGFDADNAEPILRACAALRLRLRRVPLAPLGDELLESGEVDVEEMEEGPRRAFLCYLFLATVQELIIQHLDESILGD